MVSISHQVAIRQGSIGHLRYVMKDTLQMLPLYGYFCIFYGGIKICIIKFFFFIKKRHYFYQHGCIYVKRGDFKQRKMEEALEYLQDPKINVFSKIKCYFTCMY